MILPEGTVSGIHQPVGDIWEADSILVQEFSSDPNLKPNQEIITRFDILLCEHKQYDLPIFVSRSIAQVLRERVAPNNQPYNIAHSFEGTSATNGGENLGTYGELQQYLNYRPDRQANPNATIGYHRPILVTSGYNAGNIVRQARKMDIEPIVPDALPHSFDPRSTQLWTKNRLLWVASTPVRLGILALNGH